MVSRTFSVAFVLLLACATEGTTSGGSTSGGSGNGTSSGASSGASGSTFCALTEITTRTCPNPARQDHSWATICEENIPDCKVLNRAGKNFEQNGCDVDVTYKLSGKNDKGPFPGTCEDYRRWDDGRDECMEAKDCLNYPNVECRNKTCFCGEERFDTDVIGKLTKSKCDGTRGPPGGRTAPVDTGKDRQG